MANLVNLQAFDKAFKESVESINLARGHIGLVSDHLSERPRISQTRFNMATAEMQHALGEIANAMGQLQFAVSNLVHSNRDGRG